MSVTSQSKSEFEIYLARRAAELTQEDANILARNPRLALIGIRDDRLGFASARYQVRTRMWRERRRAKVTP
jgi:hypothetical protein